ncbi:MAG TPA: SAM-dependent chlorinase/fluorinase [Candidatus Kapabacteria bacterium]|nr:SAM-dependent chlorinase/fluorinase [Candidatus Kapabacteria bacterium]
MKYLILFLFAVFALVSCTEENITNLNYKRTLVLITDFEPSTDLVLSIKGEIRDNFKDVEVVVLHAKKFDIYEGGYLLQSSFNYFPKDAYFCLVVDPGSSTKKFYTEYQGRKIFAPDNGIASLLTKNQNLTNTYYLDDMKNFPNYTNLSEVPYLNQYLMGVKKMLQGDAPNTYGSAAESLVSLDIQEPVNNNGIVSGQILFVDNFGNCVTNITKTQMNGFAVGDFIEIKSLNKTVTSKLANSYNDVPSQTNVLVYDDNLKLTLASSFSNFSEKFSLKAGDKITLSKKNFVVGVLRYNDSELSENIWDGIKVKLKSYGLNEGANISYYVGNANGDVNNFQDIIYDMVNDKVDIIIPISTPASQAAVKYVPTHIPIVYTYVTSPEYAGLIGKRNNITGISDATNFNDYLKFVKEMLPELVVAGRIYNSSEPNSAFAQEEFNKLSSFYNVSLENETITSANQVSQAFNNLKNKDIATIMIAADNTMNLAMKDLAPLCSENSIKLIGDSQENVDDGALAAISVDYDILADISGSTIYSVMLGYNPDDINIIKLPTSHISINKKVANKINYTFPQSVLNKANYVVE